MTCDKGFKDKKLSQVTPNPTFESKTVLMHGRGAAIKRKASIKRHQRRST
jgi:hypothetical protein